MKDSWLINSGRHFKLELDFVIVAFIFLFSNVVDSKKVMKKTKKRYFNLEKAKKLTGKEYTKYNQRCYLQGYSII